MGSRRLRLLWWKEYHDQRSFQVSTRQAWTDTGHEAFTWGRYGTLHDMILTNIENQIWRFLLVASCAIMFIVRDITVIELDSRGSRPNSAL